MSLLSRVYSCLFILALLAQRAFSQQPDSAACRAVVSNPVRDSLSATVGVMTTAFDQTITLTAAYRSELAAAIREVLHVPAPLPLVVYDMTSLGKKRSGQDSMSVTPTVIGAYAARLLPDGRMGNIRVIGGARATAFDDAFLRALRVLSDSGLLPPRQDPRVNDSLELRFTVFPNAVTLPSNAGIRFSVLPMEPLFRMRVPALGEGKILAPMAENVAPRYPEGARARRIEGNVLLQFVVGTDGLGELDSVQILQATSMEFVSAVLTALPRLRFHPLEIRGCALRSVAQMPFEFRLVY
jgi:TonB family protein